MSPSQFMFVVSILFAIKGDTATNAILQAGCYVCAIIAQGLFIKLLLNDTKPE